MTLENRNQYSINLGITTLKTTFKRCAHIRIEGLCLAIISADLYNYVLLLIPVLWPVT